MWWGRMVIAVCATALLIGTAAPALAAPLAFAAVTPPDSAALAAAPTQVTLTFTAPVDAAMTGGYVHDLDGVVVSTSVRVNPNDRAQVIITLAPNLPSGWYMVMWNTAPDGSDDLLSGMSQFNIL